MYQPEELSKFYRFHEHGLKTMESHHFMNIKDTELNNGRLRTRTLIFTFILILFISETPSSQGSSAI